MRYSIVTYPILSDQSNVALGFWMMSLERLKDILIISHVKFILGKRIKEKISGCVRRLDGGI